MNKTKLIVGAAVLAVMIAVCVFAYNEITKKYTPDTPVQSTKAPSQRVTAPDFTVYNDSDEAVKLSDFSGKPVVINFWATWCPPCKSELPYFEKLAAEYENRVEFMMVNLTDGQQETPEIVKDFVSENGYTFPVYYDLDYSGAMAYGTNSIPVTVFVDKTGKVFHRQVGAINEKFLRAAIEQILK